LSPLKQLKLEQNLKNTGFEKIKLKLEEMSKILEKLIFL
jgi:hypothetical protein